MDWGDGVARGGVTKGLLPFLCKGGGNNGLHTSGETRDSGTGTRTVAACKGVPLRAENQLNPPRNPQICKLPELVGVGCEEGDGLRNTVQSKLRDITSGEARALCLATVSW